MRRSKRRRISVLYDLLKIFLSNKSDCSPKFCLQLGISTRQIGAYLILDVTPKNEVARGQVCRAWWPGNRTTSANAAASGILIQIIAHKKSKMGWGAIRLKYNVWGAVPKIGKEKLAKHFIIALRSGILVFTKLRASNTSFRYATPCQDRFNALLYFVYFLPAFSYQDSAVALVYTTRQWRTALIGENDLMEICCII